MQCHIYKTHYNIVISMICIALYTQLLLIPYIASYLLIFDGHMSHISAQTIELAIKEQITLPKLPPHCTDVLQVLDVAVFSSLKNYYEKILTEHVPNTLCTQPLTKALFTNLLADVWYKGLSKCNNQSGFRCTGTFPADAAKYSEERIDKVKLIHYRAWKDAGSPRNEEGDLLIPDDDNQHDKPSSVDGQHDEPSSNDGQHDEPSSNDGQHDEPSSNDGQHDEPSSNDGQHDEPSSNDGQHDEPSSNDGQHDEPSSNDGQHDEPSSNDGQHDEPSSNDGQHDEPSSNDGQHDEPSSNDGQQIGNTVEDRTL